MILALNTSTPQFGLAFMEEDGTLLAEYFMSKERGFGSLIPALHFLLTKLKADLHDQKAIIVATGPGSFTGLRVGISAAKGLCHALKIPIIGVSSLEAMASQVLYSELPIVPLLYSRRNEFFTTQFSRNNTNKLISNMENIAVRTDDMPSIFKEPSVFIGNDFLKQAHAIKKCLGSLAHLAPAHIWSLKASSVGALGLKRFHDKDFDEPQTLDPLYLRPPDIRTNPFPLMTGSQNTGTRENRNTGH